METEPRYTTTVQKCGAENHVIRNIYDLCAFLGDPWQIGLLDDYYYNDTSCGGGGGETNFSVKKAEKVFPRHNIKCPTRLLIYDAKKQPPPSSPATVIAGREVVGGGNLTLSGARPRTASKRDADG